jgi:hypothetical protein
MKSGTIVPYVRDPVALELAVAIRAGYRRWVAFHSDYEAAESGLMTLWTFMTWVFDVFDVIPYILVYAPTSEAGKSVVFDVADLLVREPFKIVDPTPASIFRAVDLLQPTMLLDETDQLNEIKQLRAILNAGNKPGTLVPRAKASYRTFCPKIFTGIAGVRPPLTRTTLSRCIEMPMRRRGPRDPDIERFFLRKAKPVLVPYRNALQEWSLRAWPDLEEIEPDPLPGLTDRQWDSWFPLIVIADYLSPKWGIEARHWCLQLTGARERDPDPAVQILADCKKVLDTLRSNKIPTARLAELCNGLDERDYDEYLSPRQLGIRLSQLGIRSDEKPFRMPRATKVTRGFTFRYRGEYTAAWTDAFERYGVA